MSKHSESFYYHSTTIQPKLKYSTPDISLIHTQIIDSNCCTAIKIYRGAHVILCCETQCENRQVSKSSQS